MRFGTLVAIQAMKEYILKYLSTIGLLHPASYTFPDKNPELWYRGRTEANAEGRCSTKAFLLFLWLKTSNNNLCPDISLKFKVQKGV